jgi:hypothetical protein
MALLALLIVFLRDHGPCAWSRAGMTWPTHLAVVPSGRGRPGLHPLRALAGPVLAGAALDLPWARLSLADPDDPGAREADPGRFLAAPVPGAGVLLLDDTWTTGASAQSAAAALRLAGARSVAVVVLGCHLRSPPPGATPFRPDRCVVHPVPADSRAPPSELPSVRRERSDYAGRGGSIG